MNAFFRVAALLSASMLLWSVESRAQEEAGGMDFGDTTEPAPETPPPPEEASPAESLPDDVETPAGEGAASTDSGEGDKSALDEGIDLTLQDRIKAISRKVFIKEGRFELQPAVAVTTNDPFFRAWGIAGRGAWHLNDAFALEIGGVYVPRPFIEELPPVDYLADNASLVNIDNKLNGLVDLGFTFSPLYGKLAVLSDAIIHFDAFVAAGGGTVFDANVDFIHPTMDIGVGTRVFLLDWLVIRADLRDYIYPQDQLSISTLQNLLMFSLGVGFYFPFGFEYRYEAAKVRS